MIGVRLEWTAQTGGEGGERMSERGGVRRRRSGDPNGGVISSWGGLIETEYVDECTLRSKNL